jgi:hypothetical protein
MDFSLSRFLETTLALIIALGVVDGVKLFILSYFEDIVQNRRLSAAERREIRSNLLNILSAAKYNSWKIPPTVQEATELHKAKTIIGKKDRLLGESLMLYLYLWKKRARLYVQYIKYNKYKEEFEGPKGDYFMKQDELHKQLIKQIS